MDACGLNLQPFGYQLSVNYHTTPKTAIYNSTKNKKFNRNVFIWGKLNVDLWSLACLIFKRYFNVCGNGTVDHGDIM